MCCLTFLARLDEVQEELLYYPGIGVGVGVGGGGVVSKKFDVKVFYVMSKALSGKLSCPCDRSCYVFRRPQNLHFFFSPAIFVMDLM